MYAMLFKPRTLVIIYRGFTCRGRDMSKIISYLDSSCLKTYTTLFCRHRNEVGLVCQDGGVNKRRLFEHESQLFKLVLIYQKYNSRKNT